MFYNNNLRPAFASANNAKAHNSRSEKEFVTFSAANSETDDFNSFNTSQGSGEMRRPPKKKKKPQKTFELSLKTVAIAAAVLVAAVLLIVIFVSMANSSGSNLTLKNNSYLSYDIDGTYYVAMNGKTLDQPFENEISLIPADDNSFAYVVEHTSEGDIIYILEDKELTQISSSPVKEILTMSKFNPGIIYRKDNDAVYFYTAEDEGRITRSTTAANFMISDDASAIVYTEPDNSDATASKLYLYVDGGSESLGKNMVPVAVSKGGKYIYAYAIVATETSVTKKLYLIKPEEESEKIEISSNFDEITYLNVKGDEIIYSSGVSVDKIRSHVYSAKKNESYEIGAGRCVPTVADHSVVCLSTLKNIVVQNTIPVAPGTSATHYINKNYEATRICGYNGTLNSKGDIFYYIDKDDTLRYIDLNDKTRTPEKIFDDVIDFVVTEKDNIYFIMDELDRDLIFYKSSTGKRKTIAGDVTSMTFNEYSNVLYFNVDEDTKAYLTEEGSVKEIAEFDRAEIAVAPTFTDPAQKRSYAYIINPETDLYDIYFTSSGKSFKLVAKDCDSVNAVLGTGDFFDAIRDALEDIFGDWIEDIIPDGETSGDEEAAG